ncbi:DUF6082 family protein [Streptomyces sp. NPDC004042]|uniref:DUF6082 family protein n=1 Tax=Streptomyces sp. NPDC004042 TaxID=3154451 RepID=UPI0033ACAD50
MKTPIALGLGLVGTGLGALYLGQRERHHKEIKRLELARWHDVLIRDTLANDPALAEIHGEIDEVERATILRQNRWVCLWSCMMRFGYTHENHMREVARRFMTGEAGRLYWAVGGPHRRLTAQDEHDWKFNEIMDTAYAAVSAERAC